VSDFILYLLSGIILCVAVTAVVGAGISILREFMNGEQGDQE
jgi:hypothetical protein